MTSKPARLAVAFLTSATLSLAPMLMLATGAQAGQPEGYGPSDPFDDALMGDTGPVEPMKNQAKIVRTKYGYMLTAGQQNSHLSVTLVDGRLRFADTGTRSWKSLPGSCKAQRASRGIAATCRVPATTSAADPTLLEFHPRLGNDYVGGRTLPAVFEMAVLADAGRDTVFAGHGNDFINAAQDADRAHGGAGNDWIRGGKGGDHIWGDSGNDYLVGQDGRDAIDGGTGENRIYQ
jgi:serralysin